MRRRRSRASEVAQYRAIGRTFAAAAAAPALTPWPCGHSCDCAPGECPCSAGECDGADGTRATAEWWLQNTDAGRAMLQRRGQP